MGCAQPETLLTAVAFMVMILLAVAIQEISRSRQARAARRVVKLMLAAQYTHQQAASQQTQGGA